MNIPARVASLYAAETDPQKIHQNLEDEIRSVLIDLVAETETGFSQMHAAEVYGTAFSQGLRPESRLTVSEWADRYRLLSQRASAEAGRWRTARTPYLREIMDALSSSSP